MITSGKKKQWELKIAIVNISLTIEGLADHPVWTLCQIILCGRPAIPEKGGMRMTGKGTVPS